MLKRAFINASTKKCFLIINQRNIHINSNISKYKLYNNKNAVSLSVLQIDFTHKKFFSSDTTEHAEHKVQFVSEVSQSSDNINFASTLDSPINITDSVEYIPPPPTPLEIIEDPIVLNVLGEPTFESLGLGGWTPIGLIQNALEFVHVTLDLPWWGTIAIATLVMRTAVFPLVIKAQRNAAKMNNHLPGMQALQLKLTEARSSGNHLEAAKLAYELQNFMKKNDINPMKNALVPLAQAPIFISMFIGLRRCANLPVESMKEGGLFWFTDLTVVDPFYALPVITSLTMLATIELGTDTQRMSSSTSNTLKYVLRGLPLIIFPFIINFPAAILCYWVSTNLFSLIQVGFLKIPRIRTYFKIDALQKHSPSSLPPSKGFVEGIRDSISNMKISSEIAERQRIDEIKFKKAGTGPLIKTFKHNPVRKNVIDVKANVKNAMK